MSAAISAQAIARGFQIVTSKQRQPSHTGMINCTMIRPPALHEFLECPTPNIGYTRSNTIVDRSADDDNNNLRKGG